MAKEKLIVVLLSLENELNSFFIFLSIIKDSSLIALLADN
jgi:hypothetical protein